ncbi:MAG: O-antigen ligase family protein [Ardenticatenaceae bacterium]|nr:O-antigen ligase family protein [Ardenticatenaceae bacterium]MCB8991026.1 O-antigen ligase family protein [Ardenticatenaceae bacterium]
MSGFIKRALYRVAAWEWVWYLLLLPALLFPSGWRSLALLGIPLLWLLRWLATRQFLPRTAFNGAILLMAVMALVSLYATFDMQLSFPKIAGLVMGMALFFTAVTYAQTHKQGQWHVVGFVLLTGTAMAGIGAIGMRWVGPLSPLNRVQDWLPTAVTQLPGTVSGVNANELAGIMNWIAPLALALLVGLGAKLWQEHKFILLVLAGISLTSMLVLAGTFSRGGIASFGISIIVMLVMSGKWGRWLAGTAVLIALLLLLTLNLDTILPGTADPTNENDPGLSELGMDGRLEIWSRAVYGLEDFPFTGMSMNGFRRVVHILYPLFLVSPDTDIAHAHNHLLQAGLDLGLPGLIAYLALWLINGTLIWQSWKQASQKEQRVLIIGLAGALIGGWFFGILDTIALGARPGFLWWLLLSLAATLHES